MVVLVVINVIISDEDDDDDDDIDDDDDDVFGVHFIAAWLIVPQGCETAKRACAS